jgi:hypothetical protein
MLALDPLRGATLPTNRCLTLEYRKMFRRAVKRRLWRRPSIACIQVSHVRLTEAVHWSECYATQLVDWVTGALSGIPNAPGGWLKMEPRIPHGWATMIGDLVRVRAPRTIDSRVSKISRVSGSPGSSRLNLLLGYVRLCIKCGKPVNGRGTAKLMGLW